MFTGSFSQWKQIKLFVQAVSDSLRPSVNFRFTRNCFRFLVAANLFVATFAEMRNVAVTTPLLQY